MHLSAGHEILGSYLTSLSLTIFVDAINIIAVVISEGCFGSSESKYGSGM